MPIVYKITYPNGKIYLGKDETDTITYFGTPDAKRIAADFSAGERQSFTVTRDILWQAEAATRQQVNAIELNFIRKLGANDPLVGYNRRPKLNPAPEPACTREQAHEQDR